MVDRSPHDARTQRALSLLFERSNELLWAVDGAGRVTRASHSHAHRLGRDPSDLVGLPEGDCIHPEDREACAELLRSAAAGTGGRGQARLRDREGRWRWLSLDALPLAAGDTAPEPSAEAALVIAKLGDRSEDLGIDLFRTLAENIPGVVYLCANDETDSMMFLSHQVEELTGLSVEAFLAGDVSFVDLYHPDDVDIIGPRVDAALAARRPFHLVYRLRHIDGSYRWIEEHGQGVFDDRGELVFLEGTLFDTSARVADEKRRRQLETQLARAGKLESLGMLAGGIAHDFNNVLLAIMGGIELAKMSLDEPASNRETIDSLLDDALSAANHAADLTRQLLIYAGKGGIQRSRLTLPELIEGMAKLLETSAPKHTTLRFSIGPAAPLAVDRPLMQQALLNLVLNAADAIGAEPGAIDVRTGICELSPAEAAAIDIPGPIDPGTYAWLEVEDDGAGMSEHVRARIFDPFFTTKSTGHGLGVATVLGVVRTYRGGLQLRSAPGVGTCFRLLLPIASATGSPELDVPTVLEATDSGRHRASTPARILVVDDEQRVRRLIRDVLASEGHDALEAATLDEGLALLEAHGDQIELAILDINLPDGSGFDLFERLRVLRPRLPVLLSSGFATPHPHMLDQPRVSFLAKPYRPQALADRVTSMLGHARMPAARP